MNEVRSSPVRASTARRRIRPGFFMQRIVNPIAIRLGRTPTLTVVGRHSGIARTIPFGGPFEHDGVRYLVSGRGSTDWVRNLRAAGRAELRSRGTVEAIRAVEVAGAEHAKVLAAYRERFGRALDRYFSEIPDPSDHPVFRIETI